MSRRKNNGGKQLIAMLILTTFVFTVWLTAVTGGGNSVSVERTLPDSVEQNEKFNVTLNQTGFLLNAGIVWEALPEGFDYVNGSYTGSAPEKVAYDPTTRTLKVPFAGETTIRYSVEASSYEQIAVFSGTWTTFDSQMNEINGTVTGDTEVRVEKDEMPPASITNLQYNSGSTWIMWTWTNPEDDDFSHVMVYINGSWRTNTSYEFYNAKGLNPDTEYEIGTRTVDKAGNINGTWVNGSAKTTRTLDTGAGGTYPSIAGIHEGYIIPNQTIEVKKLYTYPCEGTGGHTEYVKICNVTSGWCITATWGGYKGDYRNIIFPAEFTLKKGGVYNYTIVTGSYPQIIHNQTYTNAYGSINCTKFEDMNGRVYDDWIPAMRLFA